MKLTSKVTVNILTNNGASYLQELDVTEFPTGEIMAHLSPECVRFCQENGGNMKAVVYVTQGFCKDLLFKIALAKEAVTTLIPVGNVTHALIMAYLPNARYDRHMFEGDAAALKVFANLVNSLGFNAVSAFDVHSSVAENLFPSFREMSQVDILEDGKEVIRQKRYDFLVAPDAGASKKIHKVSEALGIPYITMHKHRDVKTGEITGISVLDKEDLTGKTVLIVDDICDGGRTFVEAAKVLHENGANVVDLYVTHGIFSAGVERLFEGGINSIYTTDTLGSFEERGFANNPRMKMLGQ